MIWNKSATSSQADKPFASVVRRRPAMPAHGHEAEGLISVANAFPKPAAAMVERASFGQTHKAKHPRRRSL